MNLAGVVKRNGMSILWQPMQGQGGTYDPVTRTMLNVPVTQATPISGIVDGFGTQASSLRSFFNEKDTLLGSGEYRIYTTQLCKVGDIFTMFGQTFAVTWVKSVIYQGKAVLYEYLVKS